MGEGEDQGPAERVVVRRRLPFATSLDAGCVGFVSFVVLFGGVLALGVGDREEGFSGVHWQLAVGLAGFLLALAILVGARPRGPRRENDRSREDDPPPGEGSSP